MLLYKTMHHFFPVFQKWLKALKDPRNPESITYPLPVIVWHGLLLYLLKLGARRQITYELATDEFTGNLQVLTDEELEKTAHDGTLAYLFERLDPAELHKVRTQMIHSLIRGKCFSNYRVLGHYPIVMDGTGYLAFKERHCDHCLHKNIKNKEGKVIRTYYYHPVVEAKLVTENGMALSVGSEFVENPDKGADIQDCELQAAYRLMDRIKRDFPQLRICLLLDALYAGAPVFSKCHEYKWKYIITFKQGSMPEVWNEYVTLKKLQPENTAEIAQPDLMHHYRWVTDIGFSGPRFHVIECKESKPRKNGTQEHKTFVWLTNFRVGRDNFKSVASGGRMRWKIENEGFNMQKTGGYNLEHAYSIHKVGLKNFYLALQIAHIISQLMEKGSLLAATVKKLFGSIRNFTRRLLESLRTSVFDLAEIEAVKQLRFQIRLQGPD